MVHSSAVSLNGTTELEVALRTATVADPFLTLRLCYFRRWNVNLCVCLSKAPVRRCELNRCVYVCVCVCSCLWGTAVKTKPLQEWRGNRCPDLTAVKLRWAGVNLYLQETTLTSAHWVDICVCVCVCAYYNIIVIEMGKLSIFIKSRCQ